VRLALGTAMQSCSAAQAAVLMARASDEALPSDLRALGIRAVASHRSMETLNWLLSRVAGGKRFLFRRSLASKSPEMLAALAGLAAHWSNEPAARKYSPRPPSIRILRSATRRRVVEARDERTRTIPDVAGPGVVDDDAVRGRPPGALARHRRGLRAPAGAADEGLAAAVLVLGYDVVYGNIAMRELKEWDWGARLANAGIQRLEFDHDVTRDDFEVFLDECLARLTLQFIDSATEVPSERPQSSSAPSA